MHAQLQTSFCHPGHPDPGHPGHFEAGTAAWRHGRPGGCASRSAAAGAARRWSMDLMVRSDFELFPLSCALFLPLTDGQNAVRLVFVVLAPKR